jgi:hypothetical protein
MEVELKLSVEEVNSILNVLGELPTKTGAFPLAVKIKQQAEAQLPKAEDKTEE